MSNDGQSANTSELKPTPKQGAKPEELRAFIDGKLNYQSVTRTRRASKWTKAARYREARQWGEPSFNGSTSLTPHWTDLSFGANDDDAIPMPTQPEIFVHISNEQARLGKPEFEPYVRADGENPSVKDRKGAQIAERALQDRLREMDWEEIEAEADLDMPLFGQSIVKSWWRTDSTKATRVPVTTAKACPRHPKAMGGLPEAPVEAADPDAAPEQTGDDASTGDTALEGQSQAEAMATDDGMPVPDALEGEPEPEQACDFVTCKPYVDNDLAQTLPPETLSTRSEPVQGKEGVTELKFALDTCPQCQDHPPLVPFYPSDQEAAKGKDSFGRPLGESKPLGDWMLEAATPDRFFPASMGVGIKARDWPWWLDVYPLHVSDIAKFWANGKLVIPEQAQTIMQWHPVAGERSIYEAGATGDAGVFEGFARVKEYHEKPSPVFPQGRSIIMSGNIVLLDSTFLVPSQNVPGETFDRVALELIPWEIRRYDSFGLSMFELLESLQDDINEERSREADIASRMGTMFWTARRGMNLDTVGLEAGGYSGKVVEFDTDPLAPQTEPKAVGGNSMHDAMVSKVQFYIDAMGRISGSSEPETGPPSGSPWSSVALQFQAEKSGERRGNRLRRKRKALERLFTHGLTLMYHRCLEPRKLRFEEADGQFKERAWRGIEFNGQLRVTIDAESEHDTAFQKQQKLMDAWDKDMYDKTNPSVRDQMLKKLELPRELGNNQESQESNASREFCDFRDIDKEPIVDESIDDPMVHHEQHGKDIQGEEFRDMEEAAQWDTIYPYLCDWKQQWPMLQMALQAGMVNRPPLLELQILAGWDALLLQRKIVTAQLPPDQIAGLRKVMRFRAHYEAHVFAAELAAQQAAMGQPGLAAPGSDETASGTTPTPGQPAVQPGMPQPQPAGIM